MTNKFNKDLSNYDKLKYVLAKPYIFKNLLINNDISTDFMFSDSINQKLAVLKIIYLLEAMIYIVL